MIEFSRRDFQEQLNNAAGLYEVKSISTMWHDIDEWESEFTEEEGFTITIKKGKIEYKKDFRGEQVIHAIPAELLEEDDTLTLEMYNAQRVIAEMGIK